MADIHQPLHAVADYQGGNAIGVSFFADAASSRKAPTTLHLLWDFGLIRRSYLDWGAYVDHLERTWLGTAAERDVPPTMDAADWAGESSAIARSDGFMAAKGADLDDTYLRRFRPLLDQQLARAGLRLAKAINEAAASD